MRISTVLLTFVFLGAGCAQSSVNQEFFAEDSDSQEQVQIVEEEIDMTTYVMSSKVSVLFEAPTGWFVRQADAGPVSIVTIREAKSSEAQMTIKVDLAGEVTTASDLDSDLTTSISDSIVVSPTTEQIEVATRVSEWTVEDTR